MYVDDPAGTVATAAPYTPCAVDLYTRYDERSVSVLGVQVKVADDVDGALSVRLTPTVLVMPPPVTVIAPLFVPTVAVEVFTLTVTVPLFDPLAGLTVSQPSGSLTVHEPLELMVNDCAAGLAAPCVALKLRLAGPTLKVGAGAETAKETGIDSGEFVAPVPVTVIEAVCTAADSPAALAVTVKLPGAVPEAGEIESHVAVLEALQLNAPVPVLMMFRVCAAGLLPPCVAEKARLAGVKPMVGIGAGVSVSVTMTVCGVLVAPVAEIVSGVE